MQLGFPGMRTRSAPQGQARRSRWRPVIMMAMAAGLGVAALGSGFVASSLDEPGAARRAADAFVPLVLGYDFDAAEAQMCEAVQSGAAPSDWSGFDRYLRDQADEGPLTFAWSDTIRRSGAELYTRVRYTVDGADDFTLEIRVAREDGVMKPCGIDVVDPTAS